MLRYRQLPTLGSMKHPSTTALQEPSKPPQHNSTTDVREKVKRPLQHHSDRTVLLMQARIVPPNPKIQNGDPPP